jgi:hypothetical protein
MTHINLFRTATSRTPSAHDSVAWGKSGFAKSSFAKPNFAKKNFDATTSTLIFAALLVVCSLAVGCSSDKPKPVTSTSDSPITQPTPPVTTTSTPAPATPVLQAAAKPVHKKVVHKAPATLTYADKTSGVSFQYPRKYALKTGEAATELVSAGPIPMDFVQPGGVTLAAVALPESAYPNSDLASAFFNVSVNKTLTADQCSEFSVPQPDPATPADPAAQAKAQLATPPISKSTIGKLMIGDMEFQSTETNSGGETSNGQREEASKYYHVFQNGACYEFALKVATAKLDTVSTTASTTKPVNRDEVFQRLEKVLATVKINSITAPEVSAEVKTQTAPAETPAQ